MKIFIITKSIGNILYNFSAIIEVVPLPGSSTTFNFLKDDILSLGGTPFICRTGASFTRATTLMECLPFGGRFQRQLLNFLQHFVT